jgi:hypothetical protein
LDGVRDGGGDRDDFVEVDLAVLVSDQLGDGVLGDDFGGVVEGGESVDGVADSFASGAVVTVKGNCVRSIIPTSQQ